MNTNVSFTVDIMTPAELNGLTAVLMQWSVGPICPPLMAKGTVIDPPTVASHSTVNSATIYLLWLKTARTRRKNSIDVAGTATAKQDPIATCSDWQLPTTPTAKAIGKDING